MTDLDRDGFILIKDFFSKEEAKFITGMGDKLFNLPEKKGGYMKYYEDTGKDRILSRIEYFINTQPELKVVHMVYTQYIYSIHHITMFFFIFYVLSTLEINQEQKLKIWLLKKWHI